MKKSNIRTGLACMLVFGLTAGYAAAQGSLTPPGAPAQTMKTLEQIEPRTPLVSGSPGVVIGSSGTITISQSGSYYLTKNLTVSSNNGITIDVSGVTVDLNGFTIRSTFSSSYYDGININGDRVSIYNGHIESGTTYIGGGGDQYTGSGFDYGIQASSSSNTGIRIRDITVFGVDIRGIYIPSFDSVVESCVVEVAGSDGIWAGIVSRCSASTCGSSAIAARTVNDCTGRSTGSVGIFATTVQNSYGVSTSTSLNSAGISALSSVQNSYGSSAGGDGIRSSGTVANSVGDTTATHMNAHGISALSSVQNSYGSSAGAHGIQACMVANSVGYSSGTDPSAHGISVTHSVQNSYGFSTGGSGIYSTGMVINSYGRSSGVDGIHSAAGTVVNSYGITTGAGTNADGIDADYIVQNSYGCSDNGDGIEASIVANSYGFSATTNVNTYGIVAYIATSCNAAGDEHIAHKYNMP